jgi:hypothetical protein
MSIAPVSVILVLLFCAVAVKGFIRPAICYFSAYTAQQILAKWSAAIGLVAAITGMLG